MPYYENLIPVAIDAAEVEDALVYIFQNYNKAGDGNLTRKEFFTFLWELKTTAHQDLTEGQMMSCWLAVSRKQPTVNFEDFRDGLEICYEKKFFARENGVVPPPFFLDEVGSGSYNTVKFQQSQGVAAFNRILEDEKATYQDRNPRPMTVYGQQHRPSGLRGANAGGSDYVPAPSSTNTHVPRSARGTYEKPPVAPRPDKTPMAPIANQTMKKLMLQKEKEQKKLESRKKMDEILAARHKAQKQERDQYRQRMEEQKRQQLDVQADNSVGEPLWLQNLKNKKKNQGQSQGLSQGQHQNQNQYQGQRRAPVVP